jgi:hypothetical protein
VRQDCQVILRITKVIISPITGSAAFAPSATASAVTTTARQVLGDYGGQRAAVGFYAINLACVSLAFQAQIMYASDLVWSEAREFERRMAGPANFLVATVFLLSIPIAFLSTTAATVMWIGVFAVGRRLEDRVAGLLRRRGPARG